MNARGSESNLLTYPQLQHLLRIEFSRARRYHYPLSCLVMQVDRLDHLRDLYSPAAKNEILDRVVQMVLGQTRISDAVAYYGDRVTVLLPHTGESGAEVISSRLGQRATELDFKIGENPISLSLSMGVSTFDDHATIFYDAILKNAEKAMMEVSQAGGNGIRFHRAPLDGAPV